MAGNNRPPYRPPCAGWEYAWNGKAYQHARRTENNIPQWQNNNCNDSSHPTLHYPQADDAWLEANGDGTCSPAATLCGTPGQPLCGPFAYDGRLATDYEQLETTANYGVCKNIGHKTVQAHKSWHGTRFPVAGADVKTKYLTATYYANYEQQDRKSTRLNSSHSQQSRMPSSA